MHTEKSTYRYTNMFGLLHKLVETVYVSSLYLQTNMMKVSNPSGLKFSLSASKMKLERESDDVPKKLFFGLRKGRVHPGKIFMLSCSFFLVAFSANAQSSIVESVSYRKSIMTSLGGQMGAMAHIIRGQIPEYQPHLKTLLNLMKQTYQLVPGSFQEKTRHAQSHSKQEIWDQAEQFQEALKKTENSLNQFYNVAEQKDWKLLARELGQLRRSCKECHKNFRLRRH